MARQKIKSATDQRPFIMVYQDFLESDLLDNHYQKLVYVYLKKFADSKNQCFPSVKTLSKLTKISVNKVKLTLAELEQKGVISKENRTRPDGGKSSNLYTLYDFKELWNAGSSEEVAAVVDEYEDKKLISLLEAKGYTIIKEKEPDKTEPTKVTVEPSTKLNQFDMVNTTINATSCQDQERYTLDDVKDIFGYEAMVHDAPELKSNIDSVMDVLHNALNTTAETIRVNKKDVPGTVARKKLLELTNEEILFTIRKYRMQTGTINNTSSYILTQLFNAHRDMDLELTNKIQQQIYG